MFRPTSPQRSLFSVENRLGAKKRERLEASWAHQFREKALPLIDESKFAKYFCADDGRPNKSIRLVVSTLLLKEVHDLTDAEALEQLEWNTAWHYALDVVPEDAHTCQKTLHNTRVRLLGDDEGAGLFEGTTARLIAAANLKTARQRQDSTHIVSNLRMLTRLGLFVQTITAFLKKLRDEHPRLYAGVSEELSERYLDREGYFADARASEGRRRVEQAALDVFWIVTRFGENRTVKTMESFQLVDRLYREQCVPPSTEIPEKIELQESPSSSSLQSPSDPDVTYSGHKGKGYSVQLAETCVEENPFQAVTAVVVHAANEGDAQHVADVAEQIQRTCGAPPEEVHADCGYASGANFVEAKERGTELRAPVAERPTVHLPVFTFEFDEKGERVLACPNGEVPYCHKTGRNGTSTVAVFLSKQCKRCPLKNDCPTEKRIGKRVLEFDKGVVAVARRREEQDSPAFKERHRIRSGIEATNSELKRDHGLGKLRVRRRERVTLAVHLKVLALNIKRYVAAALAVSATPQSVVA